MQEDILTITSLMAARAYLYELLHKALGGKPTQGLVGAVASPECIDAIDEYVRPGNGLEEFASFAGTIDATDPVVLECAISEYNHLLMGLGAPQLALWESSYVSDDGTLFGESALAVRTWYRSDGMRMRRQGSVPDDHLSSMMAFLARSARVVYDAMRSGRFDEVASRLEKDGCFLSSHINNWTRALLDRVAEKEGSFYPQIIRGTVAFARADAVFAEQVRQWATEAVGASFEDIGFEGFARMESAIIHLTALRLPFLEDNELIPLDVGIDG